MTEFRNKYCGIRFLRMRHIFSGILIFSIIIGMPGITSAHGKSFYSSPKIWQKEVISNERQVVPDELKQLYAQSAVLMDADSGRILFAKNGQEERAMASTTKIMTCILALENSKKDQIVTVSENAAAQPKVKLGMTVGEQFYLKDLLYSLMLESHNDSAVVIAEGIAGSVENFAELMNAKAREIGCYSTYFITPNGLDASDSKGIHHTTAADLARILRYCIMISEKKDEFLTVTRTAQYQFQDVEGKRIFYCYNHNAFLHMMEGALSGKTGFTSDAGYCYIGSLRRDDRTFIVALLACGWPNNKGYKWADMKTLMTYALEHYHYKEIQIGQTDQKVLVEDGVLQSGKAGTFSKSYPQKEPIRIALFSRQKPFSILLREDEDVTVEYEIPEKISAPVIKGDRIGRILCYLNGDLIQEYPVYVAETLKERTFMSCFDYISNIFFLFCQKE